MRGMVRGVAAFVVSLYYAARWWWERRYEKPARWWHSVGMGLYFFNDDGPDHAGRMCGHWSLKTPFGWFRLWAGARKMHEPDARVDSWGVTVDWQIRSVVFQWGGRRRYVELPCALVYVSRELMLRESSGGYRWIMRIERGAYTGGYQYPKGMLAPGQAPPLPYQSQPIDIAYTTRRGVEQKTQARILAVHRLTHRWRWVPFVRLTSCYMEVEFRDELGSEAGSWKGGVVGVGMSYRKDRNPEAEFHHEFHKAQKSHRWG